MTALPNKLTKLRADYKEAATDRSIVDERIGSTDKERGEELNEGKGIPDRARLIRRGATERIAGIEAAQYHHYFWESTD